MINLISVYKTQDSERILYDLLLEREQTNSISHRKMPTWREHVSFVGSNPYRKWYLIKIDVIDTQGGISREGFHIIGACYLTRQNEIGIQLFKTYQGKGYAIDAVNTMITKHKPLKAIPGVRSGQFLANINPANERSIRLFQKLGFTHINNTYRL